MSSGPPSSCEFDVAFPGHTLLQMGHPGIGPCISTLAAGSDQATAAPATSTSWGADFVKSGSQLTSESHSTDWLNHDVQVAIARYFSRNLSEEVLKGMGQKASQGVFPARAPIGYRNVERDGRGVIEPDEALSLLVRRFFEWYATGEHSLGEADAQGVPVRRARALRWLWRGDGGREQEGRAVHLLRLLQVSG